MTNLKIQIRSEPQDPKIKTVRPLVEEIICPAEPLEVFNRLRRLPYAFFLDSGCDHHKLGRYSFIGCDPFLVFKSKLRKISMEWAAGGTEEVDGDPLECLSGLLRRYRVDAGESGIPFNAGAVGYLSYDLKGFIEELPDRAVDDIGIPDIILGFYDTVYVRDNATGRSFISSTGLPSGKSERARQRIGYLKEALERTVPPERPAGYKPGGAVRSNFSRSEYMKAVRRAKEYIKRGDIYQVNLSQRFTAPLAMPPVELYRRLRDYSPAPFAAYLDLDGISILSSSPERFLLKRGRYIETRPIKGTRPRGADASGDHAMETELAASAKDMAEHIMIVDLERNDLGRICDYGSVEISESAIIERYANVFHMVSTVTGTLREGVDAIDCIRATFPGGSITGAPKIRSMEIIDSLEPFKRSVYTGAIGYIGFDGNMDTSIVIRTFVIKGKSLYFHVGGGIVADSDPMDEYEETLHKARGLMQALGARSPETSRCRG